jgi:hypothetical protein
MSACDGYKFDSHFCPYITGYPWAPSSWKWSQIFSLLSCHVTTEHLLLKGQTNKTNVFFTISGIFFENDSMTGAGQIYQLLFCIYCSQPLPFWAGTTSNKVIHIL